MELNQGSSSGGCKRNLWRVKGTTEEGKRVVVVGHSNTVPLIVQTLAGVKSIPPIADDEYGTLYIVTVPRIGRANLLKLTY